MASSATNRRFLGDTRKAPTDASAGPPTLRVIAAGLPRCATSSLQAALESDVFGLAPCMHMAHVAPHADRSQWVLDALRAHTTGDKAARHKLLRKLFDGYAATTDFPGIMFVGDLMDMYPDAAVVLNQRSGARVWAQSIQGALAFFGSWRYLAACALWKTDRLHWRMHRETYRVTRELLTEEKWFTEGFYEDFNERVRAEAKKRGRKVLEWKVEDGWKPLCEFLGRETPRDGRPFPHMNDAAEMRFVKRVLVTRGLVSWAVLGAAIWGAWTYGPGIVEGIVPVVRRLMS